ncbi:MULTISPECIES: N-acetylglucosamine kinase [Pseudoxanthomonas]|uniref:N-acetylglucosamine kinase-like BadF-type ATPase n=1 Tax=Pseudoxanthomonas taiwanensis J19 TaxID=935569 RepID=A0A562E7Z8_9GAMM|nr:MULTISPECIES: BadF/BadG/BcrA/BcrD ATPase family protein [Pseudoxanthomonas]RRN81126.1 N-acetylglucosamine kinase [Pseudoxanthomonas sp. SGD-10]TWH17844.1 N-acetylglucosamine kinase-like BadF-type ATPase [Pseudoxanthomonas taiwanensis J19]
MDAPCFLGVDGGGTKTRFVLIDASGKVLAEAQLGTTDVTQVGVEGAVRVLGEGIAQVVTQAGVDRAGIAHAFFGLPCHGEDGGVDQQLDAIPGELLGHDRYACGNDMVCGWAGSLACADGINIVAGTGSIGYGQYQGRAARVGGWGEVFSDEGSAYWIAVRGLNAYSRMSDGRLPKGPLHAVFNRALGLQRDLDLCARINGAGGLARGELAQLSRLVSEAAAAGDAVALAIFSDAARELAAIALALHRELRFPAGTPVPLSWSGGAFSAGELLLQPFREALARADAGFVPTAPKHPPHYGAALYAARLAGVSIPA